LRVRKPRSSPQGGDPRGDGDLFQTVQGRRPRAPGRALGVRGAGAGGKAGRGRGGGVRVRFQTRAGALVWLC